MVHRASRTLRCLTCTRRKVKCDGERPSCRRCQNGGWTCAGYRSQAVFIDEGARFREDKAAPPSPAVNHERPGARRRLVWPSQQTQGTTPRPTSHPRQPPECYRIRHLPLQDDIVFVTYFFSRLSCQPLASKSEPIDLPSALTSDSTHPQNTSLSALSAVYFGKHRRDRHAYDKGIQLYSRAMSHLRQALQDPKQAVAVDTLVGALCLCLLENVVFSAPLAWLHHYEGVSQLLKLQGPHKYESQFEMGISRYCRFLAILSAGHLRQHCFLSGPEWKGSQHLPDGATQSPMDLLLEIFADVPGLLHDSDNLHERRVAATDDEFQNLRRRTQSVLRRLREWPKRLPKSPSSSPPEGPTSATDLPPQEPCDAVALAICNAVLLCLMQPCELLSLPLFPEGAHGFTPCQSVPLFNQASQPGKALAVEICHLATSALREDKSTGMAFALIFPLQIATYYLEPFSSEATRLEGIMDCMVGENHGIEMGRRREWGDISPEQGAEELTSKNFLKAR